MLTRPFLSALLLAATLATFGCHAQVAAPGKPLPIETSRRIEVLLRQKAQMPPGSVITVGPRLPSDLPGYDSVAVTVTTDGNTSHPIKFLLSTDGRTLAQFTPFDLTADPRNLVSAAGRPARGGPDNAPVLIVGFDDLECPFCARLNATIFPALLNRYGNQVHVVYKDFPLDQHPWALRAAIDTNCLGAQSAPGYWNAIDYIHAHAGEIGAPGDKGPQDKTLSRANDQLDKLTREQAVFQKIDLARFDACIAKQDASGIEDSKKVATALGVESTPALFINGDKIEGAVPLDYIFKIVDDALRAEGQTPPPPYVLPTPPATTPAPAAATPAPAAATPKTPAGS